MFSLQIGVSNICFIVFECPHLFWGCANPFSPMFHAILVCQPFLSIYLVFSLILGVPRFLPIFLVFPLRIELVCCPCLAIFFWCPKLSLQILVCQPFPSNFWCSHSFWACQPSLQFFWCSHSFWCADPVSQFLQFRPLSANFGVATIPSIFWCSHLFLGVSTFLPVFWCSHSFWCADPVSPNFWSSNLSLRILV